MPSDSDSVNPISEHKYVRCQAKITDKSGHERTVNYTIPRVTKVINKTGQTGWSFPRYWETDFPVEYTLEEIWTMFQREGLLKRPIEKRWNDTLNKWFEVFGDETLVKEIHNFNETYKVRDILSFTGKGIELFGLSIIVYKFDDSNSLETPLNPERVINFKGFEVYSKIDMDEEPILYDGNYEPEFYVLKDDKGNKKRIHASRVRAVRHDPLGDHPEGFSGVLAAMDMLVLLRKCNYSLSELLYKRAIVPMKVIVPFGSDDNALDEAEKHATDAHWQDGWVCQRDMDTGNMVHDVETVANASEVIPTVDFTTWFLENYSIAIAIPVAILKGVTAGAVTGSEVNDRQYLSGISAIQDNIVTPILMDIYKVMQETGILPEGETELDWNPMFEYSEADLTVMRLRESIRAKDLTESGWEFEFDNRGFIKNETLEKKNIPWKLLGQETVPFEPFGGAPEEKPTPEEQRLIDEAMKGVYIPIEEKIRKESKEEVKDGIKQ
jgi:hypothetical protein